MAKQARKRAKRRDRRKAKMSKWRRAGKQMGAHVGHGSSAGVTIIFTPEKRANNRKMPWQ